MTLITNMAELCGISDQLIDIDRSIVDSVSLHFNAATISTLGFPMMLMWQNFARIIDQSININRLIIDFVSFKVITVKVTNGASA